MVARFRKAEESSTVLNVHYVCHRLALVCSDMGDELKFIEDFELTMIQLWEFLKNSPKQLKIYIKTATACKNYDNLSKHKKKHVVRTIKKVVRTRWLSLDADIDALFKEYVGMTQALRNMKEDKVIAGAQTEGLLGKIDNPTFLGTLYMLKLVLPHFSTLSKTLQKGSLNYSRISPNTEKTICKMHSIEEKRQHLNTLMLGITG